MHLLESSFWLSPSMPKTNSVNLMASTIDLSRLKAVPLFLKSQKYAYKKDSSPGTWTLASRSFSMYLSMELALLINVAGAFPDKMSLSMRSCSARPAKRCNCFTVSWISGNCEIMSNHLFRATSILASWSSFQEIASVLATICLQWSATKTRLGTFAGFSSCSRCRSAGHAKRFHFCWGLTQNGLLQKMLPQIPFYQGISRSGLGSRSNQVLSSRSGVRNCCESSSLCESPGKTPAANCDSAEPMSTIVPVKIALVTM